MLVPRVDGDRRRAGKRAALMARPGDDPTWLSQSFCRRHGIPDSLVPRVEQAIRTEQAKVE